MLLKYVEFMLISMKFSGTRNRKLSEALNITKSTFLSKLLDKKNAESTKIITLQKPVIEFTCEMDLEKFSMILKSN